MTPFKFISDHVSASASIGRMRFPSRSDYEEYFMHKGLVNNRHELWRNLDFVVEVQRHWHNIGQNGCIFAQILARSATSEAWRHVVVQDTSKMENEVSTSIREAIASPDCQILSFVWPELVVLPDLVAMLRQLLSMDGTILADQHDDGMVVRIALRIEVSSDHALSWLMGFGPFDFLPLTRQSPVTELVIRVKPKPTNIFRRLNQDRSAAHLADFPIEMPDEVMERVWIATEANTRAVLGHEPDKYTAAKVTFPIPTAAWKN